METLEKRIEASVVDEGKENGSFITIQDSVSETPSFSPSIKEESTFKRLVDDVSVSAPHEESIPSPCVALVHADDVHTLLSTAAMRQKTFQELRDASLEIGVRDERKCDYSMTPVPRIPRRSSSRHGNRQLQVPVDGILDKNASDHGANDTDSEQVDGGAFTWRCHLERHVAQLLSELRRRPDQLRVLLTAQYPNLGEEHEGSSEDEVSASNRRGQRSRVDAPQRSFPGTPSEDQKRTLLSANDVFKKLTDTGYRLGEAIYLQIRKMLIKSVKNGVIDRSSNLIRLESMFKLELRRQVTLERLQQAVSHKLEVHQEQQLHTRRRTPTTKIESSAPIHDTSFSPGTENDSRDSKTEDADEIAVTTAHHFKMQALERILLHRRKSVRQESHDASAASLLRSRSDQLEDQIQDKVTAAVYNKNRENYPFWKDPPENALSRDETTKLLRTVISSFTTIPLFYTLTVDQLIEMAKYTRWKAVEEGCLVYIKDAPMDSLIFVMDGKTAFISENEASSQHRSPRTDYERSTDSTTGNSHVHYGEMGLLSKTEMWPCTLSASTEVKTLILSREAFDAALMKLYGGSKRQNSRDGVGGKRPTSSPAARALARPLVRPATSLAREQAITRFQLYRDECMNSTVEEPLHAAGADQPAETNSLECERASNLTSEVPKPPRVSSNVYQHYPTFPIVEGSSAGSHMFRLKCIQPIAFAMKSVEDLIEQEWAPAFPDTNTLIDYMTAVESSFLFEKRNVLIKDNLRAVCSNLPFQDDAIYKNRTDDYLSYYQDTQTDIGTLDDVTAAAIEPNNSRFGTGSSGVSTSVVAFPIDGDPMTLGQFADARKRISSRLGASTGGVTSQSMRNMLASAATSATLAKHGNAPFLSSFYVPDTSFRDDMRHAVDSQAEDLGEDDSGSRTGEQRHPTARKSALPEVDDGSDGESSSCITTVDEFNPASSPTQARKMALDNIINTMADHAPTKRKVVDQEAARRVILQKHLYAANQGPPSNNPHDNHKGSVLQSGKVDMTAGAASHAPLPLRVDLQRRMEVVLTTLKMKPKTKLDLVLKYTHADFYDQFPDAVVLWEQAAHYITKREKALEALRKFELVASDPRRHFRSLSTHRLAEQKERDALFYQLNYASDLCREALDELEKRCGDAVYVENRLYRDKMKKDYTELLYEVEQERLQMIYKGIHPLVPNSRSRTAVGTSRGNQQEDVVPSNMEDRQLAPQQVAISTRSTPIESRFALSTPRESIYVSVVDRTAQEEREEREQALQEQATKDRITHKLSSQVKMHRQAQLESITSRNSHKLHFRSDLSRKARTKYALQVPPLLCHHTRARFLPSSTRWKRHLDDDITSIVFVGNPFHQFK